jgi:LAO/AO transport system ATPase
MLDPLLERFRSGDRLALARLLSLVSHGQQLAAIRAALRPVAPAARVVAVTGSGGVGKSTLIGKLIEFVRGSGKSLAVLACDPQSPLSGGALLGDRFRMPSRPNDPGVYIRSVAAPGGQGAIATHLDLMLELLQAFGFELILIETVGAGQGDTAVRPLADVIVLLLQPETGDDLQWEKAGLLEVADVIVIHKADLPGAERLEGQVRAALDLSGTPTAAVVRVSARTGQGLEELWQAITGAPSRRARLASAGPELLQAAEQHLEAALGRAERTGEPRLRELLHAYEEGSLAIDEAALQLLHLLLELDAGGKGH